MVEKSPEKFKDPVYKDLFIRYGMDEKVWNASKRNSFPYNVDIWYSCLAPFFGGLTFLITYLSLKDTEGHLATIILTCIKSIVAYIVTDRLIGGFKDTLRDKGLFGRDLNKAGI